MRVLVVGGTRFIGRRVVADLAGRGDDVAVVHRGETEPPGLPPCEHLHAPRADFSRVAAAVAAFAPDAVVDTCAYTAADVAAVLPHLPDVPVVVLSSGDVYAAYDVLRGRGGREHGVPLAEDAPVRTARYPYRGEIAGMDDYEKLDVEPPYLARGATVLRLGFVYGEGDPQRREEFVLRRVRAGRRRIPFGAGGPVLSRCHVGDAASAVLAALDRPAAAGRTFNVAEAASPSQRGWAEEILAAAGHEAELVRVPDEALPPDLALTAAAPQHLLMATGRIRSELGWRPADPADTVAASVRWHLAHPPAATATATADRVAIDDLGTDDLGADDAALAAASTRSP